MNRYIKRILIAKSEIRSKYMPFEVHFDRETDRDQNNWVAVFLTFLSVKIYYIILTLLSFNYRFMYCVSICSKLKCFSTIVQLGIMSPLWFFRPRSSCGMRPLFCCRIIMRDPWKSDAKHVSYT